VDERLSNKWTNHKQLRYYANVVNIQHHTNRAYRGLHRGFDNSRIFLQNSAKGKGLHMLPRKRETTVVLASQWLVARLQIGKRGSQTKFGKGRSQDICVSYRCADTILVLEIQGLLQKRATHAPLCLD
jgi:hypothetical protein